MNGKKSKKLRALAATLATENKSYLVKKTTKVYTDLQGNRLPYITDQTVLHPKCAKSIVKFLNKLTKEGIDYNNENIKALVSLETTSRLSELAADGYKLVK